MKLPLYRTVATVVVVAALVSVAADMELKISARAERTAKHKREQIAAELKSLKDHPWAGEYYAGDGLGVNMSLSLAPKAGFVFEWHGCLGVYDRNYGTAVSSDNRLHLSFTFNNEQEGFQGLAPELIPIRWGERRYLVPADDVKGFCNQVNDGSEPRNDIHGLYLLRRGDEKKTVSGLPSVPKEFQPHLLSRAIEAEIVAVGVSTTRPSAANWKFKDTPVTVNAGADKGLRSGMELVVTEPDNVVESVRITSVGQKQSQGIITQIGEVEPGPKAGWRVSTRARWNDPKVKPK